MALLVASLEQGMTLASFTEQALDLAEEHWPGALTLVLPRLDTVPEWLGDRVRRTIGLRCPDHLVTLELLEKAGPLAVTSANLSGDEAVIDDAEARELFGDAVTVYLEGEAPGGRASTIIDLTEPAPLTLRRGPVAGSGSAGDRRADARRPGQQAVRPGCRLPRHAHGRDRPRAGGVGGVDRGPGRSSDELAATLGTDPFYTDVLCRTAFSFDLLERDGSGWRMAPHFDQILGDPESSFYLARAARVHMRVGEDYYGYVSHIRAGTTDLVPGPRPGVHGGGHRARSSRCRGSSSTWCYPGCPVRGAPRRRRPGARRGLRRRLGGGPARRAVPRHHLCRHRRRAVLRRPAGSGSQSGS